MYVRKYVCMYVCMCVCMTCIYVYTTELDSIYIYIYIRIFVEGTFPSQRAFGSLGMDRL